MKVQWLDSIITINAEGLSVDPPNPSAQAKLIRIVQSISVPGFSMNPYNDAGIGLADMLGGQVLELDPEVDAEGIAFGEYREVSRNKGGPGSGNFGHAGRPGERGGSKTQGLSKEAQAEIAKFEEEFNRLDVIYHVEVARVISAQGDVISESKGDEISCAVFSTFRDKDAILIHNHPPTYHVIPKDTVFKNTAILRSGTAKNISQPPSPSDVGVAIQRDYQQIEVTGYFEGKHSRSVIARPAKGWPDITVFNHFVYEKIREHRNDFDNTDIDRFSYDILNATWKDAAQEFGLEYTHEVF